MCICGSVCGWVLVYVCRRVGFVYVGTCMCVRVCMCECVGLGVGVYECWWAVVYVCWCVCLGGCGCVVLI